MKPVLRWGPAILLAILCVFGNSRAEEITAAPYSITHHPGAWSILIPGRALCQPDFEGSESFLEYVSRAIAQKESVTFQVEPYQWGAGEGQVCGRITAMDSRLGRLAVHPGQGSGTSKTTSTGPARKGGSGPWAWFPSEWPAGLANQVENIKINRLIHLPPDRRVILMMTREDRKNIRRLVQEQVRDRYSVFLFGRALDDIVTKLEEDHEAWFTDQAAVQGTFEIEIPEHFAVAQMELGFKVSRKKIRLSLYQKFKDREILLLDIPVALGGSGYDHELGVNRSFGTPIGSFFIRRIVHRPYWYPPSWAGTTTPSKPGPYNPYGLWMAELSRDNAPGTYGFGVSNDTQIRIHSTNRPQSIGRYASHGCVRIHPRVAEELFPALLHYLPHDQGKKNARGTVHPLNVAVPIDIEQS